LLDTARCGLVSKRRMGGSFLLKVDVEGDIRRLRVQEGVDLDETWRAITEAVRRAFGLRSGCDVSLSYTDDEGDLCTLAKDTLWDCIALAEASAGTIKLKGTVKGEDAGLWQQQPHAASSDAPVRGACEFAHPGHVGKGKGKGKWKGMCKGWHKGLWNPFFAMPGGDPQQHIDPEGQPHPVQQPSQGTDDDVGSACRSHFVKPWQLMACLGSLRSAHRLSAPMMASLMLQFLPVMAQRAQRKKDKLNRMGSLKRDMLLPLLHRITLHLDTIPGAEAVKTELEAFVSGQHIENFGDCISSLLRLLVSTEPKATVACLLKNISEDVLDLLSSVFPRSFMCEYPDVLEHSGTRCATCSAAPIRGPRFHDTASAIDLCGECYIDFAFDASTNFECRLAASSDDTARGAFKFAPVFQVGKGKGKGKWKGLCKGMHKGLWNPFCAMPGDSSANQGLQPQQPSDLAPEVSAPPGP